MGKELNIIPRIAVRSIATGMLMMAFFSMMWTGIAYGSMSNGIIVLILFSLISLTFIVNAIYL